MGAEVRTRIALGLTVLAAGCASRGWRRSTAIANSPAVTVELEAYVSDGQNVDQGFQHPADVSRERLAALLNELRYRGRGDDPVPLFDENAIWPLAESLATGLYQATAGERVRFVVERDRRTIWILSSTFYTRGVAFVDTDSRLNLVFDMVDDSLDPDETLDWENPTARVQRSDAILVKPPGGQLAKAKGRYWLEYPIEAAATPSVDPVAAGPEEGPSQDPSEELDQSRPQSEPGSANNQLEKPRPSDAEEGSAEPATTPAPDATPIFAQLKRQIELELLDRLLAEQRISSADYEVVRQRILQDRASEEP